MDPNLPDDFDPVALYRRKPLEHLAEDLEHARAAAARQGELAGQARDFFVELEGLFTDRCEVEFPGHVVKVGPRAYVVRPNTAQFLTFPCVDLTPRPRGDRPDDEIP